MAFYAFELWPFWEISENCTWIGFLGLQALHIKVDFYLDLGMLNNVLQVNRDQIGMNQNLGY